MRPDVEDIGFLRELITPKPKEPYIAPLPFASPLPDPLLENAEKDNDGTGHK